MKPNEMVETAESDVQIILSIKEGKGFEQVLQPTLFTGTLNGHSLETDRIESSANPQYATDLIWETNKAALRKMRSGQVPLKLECFAFKENGCKEKIGYIVLSIRSAHMTSKYRDLSPKANWHKLLGLRNDLKIQKPEILLTLRVEDWKNVNSNLIEIKNVMTVEDNLQNDKIIPYLYPDEQLIQLGSLNTCYELFLLSITAVYIENLPLLLPEHLNKDNAVHFSYRVLENDVELKPFKIQSEKPDFLHEKVVVRIRSSLSVLKHYLQAEPHLLIFLKHKNSIIAESSVNLESLVVTDNLQEFLKCTANTSTIHERCFLAPKQNLVEKLIESQYPKSHLDLQLKLQYIGNKMDIVHNFDTAISSNNHIIPRVQYHNEENTSNASQRCPEIESHRNPSGDFGKLNFNNISGGIKNATECRNTNKQSIDCQCLKHQVDRSACSCDAMLCKCINKNYIKDTIGSYHCYCLHISLMTITSLSAKLSERQIEFRFHHPKAEITSTMRAKMPLLSDEKIKLQDVGCQSYFISAPNEIKQLLQSFPPQISIYDVNEDAKPLSLLTLDIKPLFHQDKPECQYKLPLYDTDRNKIGEMDITLKLENCGSHFILKKETAEQNLGPPILDDSLAYKIVDELETWKERQKEMFKAELKKKEERHLNMLNEEWRKQKENLESKLACSVEQCKMLANSLNNATEDLRIRRLKSLENETRLIKANEDLQWRYETKLQELKDSMLAMQNDLASKITKLEEKKIALEAQVEILLFENESLKSSMSQQKDELQIYQGSLAQDKTESLLQELKILEEKLENAQKGKSFFKEQWGKAVREIHRMKVDYQQEILAEILSADTAALTEDQILLNELQKEIDVIKPRQFFAPKEIFIPVDNVCSKVSWNGNMSDKSEENERLQALREERDSLLRTGSYATDDIIIKKLNTEIRSLLVSR
ncbi:centrosomal protein of 120 kDa isoform X2 [Linepithema humile]|uniref:centrosomal protein of 120 kDa isoform X2 n=1 Tax=Linepithema humile TaxID=83485 RepID=UPI00351F76C3